MKLIDQGVIITQKIQIKQWLQKHTGNTPTLMRHNNMKLQQFLQN